MIIKQEIKAPFLQSIFILTIFFCFQSCAHSSGTTIVLDNRSDRLVDSAVLTIQNYKGIILNIPAGTKTEKWISSDSIRINPHDEMVMASVYFNKISKPVDGFWYSDLIAPHSARYVVIVKPALKVTIISGE